MPIHVTCQCGRELRARDALAGRRCKCPACGALLLVPPPPPPALTLASAAPAPPATPVIAYADTSTPARRGGGGESLVHDAPAPLPVIARPKAHVAALERTWRGNLFWLLLLAMLPLAWAALGPHLVTRPTFEQRVEKTLDDNPAVRDAYDFNDDMSLEQFEEMLDKLPGRRIQGALLARGSVWHWLMALASAFLFIAAVSRALPSDDPPRAKELWLTALFTGTLGVLVLIGLQISGQFCCLGAFYLAADHPDAPFGPSLIGFVFGVGFCEEFVKCLPVLLKLYRRELLSWRAAAIIGMASGAGFGISEGVLYASRYYNGIEALDTYLVRFCSTVALHAVLSAACGVMIHRKQEHLMEDLNPFNWTMTLMAIIVMPILLHGLYNALAKHDFPAASLAVAIGSFVWFWYLIKTHRAREHAIATDVTRAPQFVRTARGTVFVPPPQQR